MVWAMRPGSLVPAPALHQNQLELLFPSAGPVVPAQLKPVRRGGRSRREGLGSQTGGGCTRPVLGEACALRASSGLNSSFVKWHLHRVLGRQGERRRGAGREAGRPPGSLELRVDMSPRERRPGVCLSDNFYTESSGVRGSFKPEAADGAGRKARTRGGREGRGPGVVSDERPLPGRNANGRAAWPREKHA